MLPRLGRSVLLVCLLCIAAIGLLSTSSWRLSSVFLGPEEPRFCSCHKCLTGGDPWLRELINASPPLFMRKEHPTSEDDFNWWKRMQCGRCNFTIFKAAVEKLLQIIPPNPHIVESSPDRCRTCAVVGNSGNLKGSHYGPLIDFNDIVIRINRGRTKGYEADVGTKTTYHVMYPESATYLDNTTHLVMFPFKSTDFDWLRKNLSPGTVNSKRRANKDLVMVLNPAFMKYAHQTWLARRRGYPSTGFLTLALSMQMCDVINVFGFGADRDGNWNHYFEELHDKKFGTGGHPGTDEYEIIELLHKQQRIVFFKGW